MKIVLKPTQSGKTQYIIDEMILNLIINDSSSDIINIIVTHNRNILTAQTRERIKNFFPDIQEISSKAADFSKVYIDITQKKCSTITMCGNITQLKGIELIINYALLHNKKVHVWADEIDFYWKTFFKILIKDKNYDSLIEIEIVGLTASVDKKMFTDSGGSLDFIHLDLPISDNYHRYTDNDIKFIEIDNAISILENYKIWLNEQTFNQTDNIFLPGEHKNISHEALKNECFLLGICPITINQFGFNIYMTSAYTPTKIDINADQSIEQKLSNIREIYNISRPIAIIGYSSPGRGITIQSPNFLFTHACILTKSSNMCTLYQLLGRLTHNYKHLNFKCKIHITQKIDKIVKDMEFKAINIHKLNIESETISYKTYTDLKDRSRFNVTDTYDTAKSCRIYLENVRKDDTIRITQYNLSKNFTIRYPDPKSGKNIDTVIREFISRKHFIATGWGFVALGTGSPSSYQARVMPVRKDNQIKWIGIYIVGCFNINNND